MSFFLTFIVYLLVAAQAYGQLPFTFFQQDEWAIFGNYLYWQKADLNWLERLFTYGQYTHIIPLSNIFSFVQFKLFQLHFQAYAVSSVFFHIVNSFLVFYLAQLLFKKRILAFLAGFFFLINSISHQAVTWIATASGTEGSVLFALLSLIFFSKYLLSVTKDKVYLFASLFFFLASLFFKETSVFIFLFLPLYWYIIKPDTNKIKKIIVFLFILGTFYISLRAIIPVIAVQPTPAISELTQPDLMTYSYRVVTMPLKVLVQSIVPAEYIIKGGNFLVKTAYPQFVATDNAPNPYIVESVSADIIIFWLAVAILFGSCGLYIFFRRKKEDLQAKILVLAIIFIGLSSLPFIFVPGRAGFLSLLDGRHLYLTDIFTSIFMAIILFGLYEILNRKRVALFILIFIFSVLSILHISKTRNDISKQVVVGQLRERLLNEILSKYPRLSDRVIFYIPSDKPFYGVEENILPFQSGLGQTLLVWYNVHGENFPSCFFEDQFLYVLLSQGYRECDGRGFGYFREPEAFKKFIMENKVKKDSIIALIYDSSTNTITDNTKNTRKTMSQ